MKTKNRNRATPFSLNEGRILQMTLCMAYLSTFQLFNFSILQSIFIGQRLAYRSGKKTNMQIGSNSIRFDLSPDALEFL